RSARAHRAAGQHCPRRRARSGAPVRRVLDGADRGGRGAARARAARDRGPGSAARLAAARAGRPGDPGLGAIREGAAVMRPLVLLAALAAATPAHAETHRLAIVLGNNVGNGDSPALHYSELDATKLSQALVELGGVEPQDLYLLHGRT